MNKISAFILFLFGWRVDKFIPKESKYVLIVAPHTSSLDFVFGRLAFWTKKLPAKFLIKKEFFKPIISLVLKALGGLPVDRGRNAGKMVEQAANILKTRDRIALIITPEGTRNANSHWKKGFWHIAKKAQVPIYIGTLDYGKKYCTILPDPIIPTEDMDSDLKKISACYTDIIAKYPEKFKLADW